MSPRSEARAAERVELREAARARLRAQFDPSRPTTPVEVGAAYVDVSRGLAYASCRDGSWPSIRVGARILILTKPFLAMLGETGQDEG